MTNSLGSARTIKQIKHISAILITSILALSVCAGSLVNAEDPPPTTSLAVRKPIFHFSKTNIVSTQGLSVSSYAISSTGGVVESFSVSPELPTGVSLNTLTGLLEGTPVDVSTASVYMVTATNAGGSSSKAFRFSVRIPPPAFLISTAEIVAIVDVPVTSYEVISSGGLIDSFKISPALPTGFDFDLSSGTISGVSSVEKAQRTYKITATNSSGRSFQLLNFKVANSSQQIELSSDNESVTLGSAMIGFTPSSTGGVGARYQISPSAPSETKFSTSSGTFTGRPVNLQEATVYTVTATNSGGSSTRTFTLTVNPSAPAFTLSRSSEAVVAGSVMTGFAVSSSGGVVASYAISPDAPAGTSFNSSTGVLSGTPTAYLLKTTYTVTARNVTDSAQQTFTLAVNATCANGGACVAGEAGPGGGAVFFVNNSGFACNLNRASTCKYMEYKDSLGAMPWSSSAINLTTTATSVSNDVIGLGYTHTSTIVGSHPQAGYAAVTARALGNNWSLPSRNELEAVFSYTGERIWAWTSNQHDLTANALVLKPAGGQAQPKRTTDNAVVPVRAFTYTYAPQS